MYKKYNGIYGYRRIALNLNHNSNIRVNHKRIYRLMKMLNLQAVTRKKRYNYIKSTSQVAAENVLNRKFTAEKSNEKWLTDVTEFKYGNGKKAYLSAILDVKDRRIVSPISSDTPIIINLYLKHLIKLLN